MRPGQLDRLPAGAADKEPKAVHAIEVPAPIARSTRQGKYGSEGPTPTHLPPIGGEQELRIALTGIEKTRRELATTRIGAQRPGKLPARLGLEAQLHAALSRCAPLPGQTARPPARAARPPARDCAH